MPEPDKWVEYGKAGCVHYYTETRNGLPVCTGCGGQAPSAEYARGWNDRVKAQQAEEDHMKQKTCTRCNGLGWIESRDHVSGYVDADPCECRKVEVPPK